MQAIHRNKKKARLFQCLSSLAGQQKVRRLLQELFEFNPTAFYFIAYAIKGLSGDDNVTPGRERGKLVYFLRRIFKSRLKMVTEAKIEIPRKAKNNYVG